jgi:hypothetical protein
MVSMTTQKDAAPYSDEEFLALLQQERQNAVGFEKDQELIDSREKALNYYKGEMPDVPSLNNRSKAMSSDVSDAVETALPDIIEIFTGGDDVLAFTPNSADDVEAAEQETDYLRHVIMQDNNGFMLLYTLIKDALLSKVGVATWWWEQSEKITETKFEGKNAVEMAMAEQSGEIKDAVQDPSPEPIDGQGAVDPTFSFTLVSRKDTSCVRIMSAPPEDFTVGPDTVHLGQSTTYCAMRARPRAQDLIAENIPAAIVAKLPEYTQRSESTTDKARDTAGEHSDPGKGEPDMLRQVEVTTHFLRIVDEAGKSQTWRIRTGGDETVLLDKEKVSGLNFAAITPFPQTHRFYGRSLADLLLELQRINTALTRALLDSAYFALNQRMIVADDASNSFTVSDLLRQEPGLPIRVKTAGAVTPVQTSGLGFQPYEALEYFATVGERRTGIVRNAQGLNPDTLHDTAGGAFALMAAAQKRVRLIAKIFAETGLKDLYLGVHALIRENATAQRIVRLRGKWVPVDPTKWGERNDMTVEVGLGASGKEHDIAMAGQMAAIMDKLVLLQGGGATGPIVFPENAYNLASDIYTKLGAKKVDRYLTDPAQAAQNGQQQPAPPPSKDQIQAQVDIRGQDLEHQRESLANQMDAQLKQRQQDLDQEAKFRQQDLEAELKRQQINTEAGVDIATAHISGQYKTSVPQVEFGGQTG